MLVECLLAGSTRPLLQAQKEKSFSSSGAGDGFD